MTANLPLKLRNQTSPKLRGSLSMCLILGLSRELLLTHQAPNREVCHIRILLYSFGFRLNLHTVVYHKNSFFVKFIPFEFLDATILGVHNSDFNIQVLRKNGDFNGPAPGVRVHYPVKIGTVFPSQKLRRKN